MDVTWVFDRGVRKTLGERTLLDWKKWLRDNNVSLKPFLSQYYPGDLEEDTRRMRLHAIDEWLFDFVNSPHGLQAARMITPDHPELEPSKPYDPTEDMLKSGPVQIGNRIVSVREKEILAGIQRAQPPHNLFPDGYKKEVEVGTMTLRQIYRELDFEVNHREKLFTYMKERRQVDLDTLPHRQVPENSRVLVCDSEGLRPGILVCFTVAGRIIREEYANVFDGGGEFAIRLNHRIRDVTGNVMEYGQAEVARQTHEADFVFIAESEW